MKKEKEKKKKIVPGNQGPSDPNASVVPLDHKSTFIKVQKS